MISTPWLGILLYVARGDSFFTLSLCVKNPLLSVIIINTGSKIADIKIANDNRLLEFVNMLAAIKANINNKDHIAAVIIDKIYIIVRKTDSEQSQLSFFNSSTYIKVNTTFVMIAITNTDKIGIANDEVAIYSASLPPDNKVANPNAKPTI